MKVSRRTLLGASALGSAAVAAPWVARAQSAEFTYKYANNLPVAHPMNQRAKEMADAIKAETNGRVEIQIFPSNQLGSDTDMLSQLRSGGIEFFTLSGLILSTLVPVASINGIGFAVPGLSVGVEGDGRRPRPVRPQPDRQGQPRRHGEDLGQRVPPDDVLDQADPGPGRPEGLQDPRAGLAALDVDVQGVRPRRPPASTSPRSTPRCRPRSSTARRNPLAIIATAKLYEVQKFCSLTNHMWDGFWFLANRRAWERLPENLRTVVAKQVNAAGVKEREDVAQLNAGLQKELTDKGMVINQPKAEAFRDKLRSAGFYAEWKGKYGDEAWSILEKYTGKLS